MLKADEKNLKAGRVSVYLDTATLKRLDLIVAQVPEIESRSAAIRYASRIIAEKLDIAETKRHA